MASATTVSADGEAPAALVDVVVVSYNSRDALRECVAPLAEAPGVRVIVVDNASPDDSLAAIADLDVERLQLADNRGFGTGCNVGWRAGSAPFVFFLNPDARLSPAALAQLVAVLEAAPGVALAAPRIVDGDGTLDFSIRRFPRLRSTYAQALFLHRLFPRARWTDEVVRDPSAYETPFSAEWVSGACMLVRRSALELIGGFDERFFLYCEDKDLCRRLRDAGFEIRFDPAATAMHVGGASTPRTQLLPVLAASRALYARKHVGPTAILEQAGVALKAATHVLVTRGGLRARAGHARSIVAALRAAPPASTR